MMDPAPFFSALLNSEAALPAGLIDPLGRPSPKRFAVYRNNVVVGLTTALKDGFPTIHQLVGDAFFSAMAGVFVRAHPPTSPVLMTYGAAFPAFLAEFPPVAHLAYLPDVARLELALRESFHAADARGVTPDRIIGLSAEDLLATRLRLSPAVRVVTSRWPILGLWLAHAKGAPAPKMRAEDVVILRPDFDPMPEVLPPQGAAFLAALLGGETLVAAIEAAPDCDVTALLGTLLKAGAIVETYR